MRYFLIICAALLLLGIVNLPIGYYTFLRIVVTIGAVLVSISEYQENKEISVWLIAFVLIAIIFNPIIPIYFNNKDIWIPIDIVSAIIFGVKSFSLKPK